MSGCLHVVHEDGSEGDAGLGDAYVIEPGHDAWVFGDEPFVAFDFESKTAAEYSGESFAGSSGGRSTVLNREARSRTPSQQPPRAPSPAPVPKEVAEYGSRQPRSCP